MPKSGDHAGEEPVPVDYDSDPARFAANQAATAGFSAAGDVHDPVAERLARSAAAPVLDLGERSLTETNAGRQRGVYLPVAGGTVSRSTPRSRP